jgi:hypothetical protein
MARGKSNVKLLLDASEAALFAGIEIHNKPNIAYRYPTAVILIVNAWELALKAFVYKYIGRGRIYENGKDGYTISFSKALILVRDYINTEKKDKEFNAVYQNLFYLNDYRCSNIHYYENALDPIIFMLINKSVINYDAFLKRYFQKDITRKDNLIILPVGFKLPFDPVEYLKQDYGNAHNDFVNSVISTIRELAEDKIKDNIVIGFDVYTVSQKKIDNADLIAAIDQENGTVALTKGYRFTDDPNAPAVRVEKPLLPLTYYQVREKIKEKRPDIKFGKQYNSVMEKIKQNKKLCEPNYLDPKTKIGAKKDFYSETAIDEIIKLYDKEVSHYEL